MPGFNNYCCVKGCFNKVPNSEGITLHTLTNADRQYFAQVRNVFYSSQRHRICSSHFLDDDFDQYGERKKDSVPVRNLDNVGDSVSSSFVDGADPLDLDKSACESFVDCADPLDLGASVPTSESFVDELDGSDALDLAAMAVVDSGDCVEEDSMLLNEGGAIAMDWTVMRGRKYWQPQTADHTYAKKVVSLGWHPKIHHNYAKKGGSEEVVVDELQKASNQYKNIKLPIPALPRQANKNIKLPRQTSTRELYEPLQDSVENDPTSSYAREVNANILPDCYYSLRSEVKEVRMGNKDGYSDTVNALTHTLCREDVPLIIHSSCNASCNNGDRISHYKKVVRHLKSKYKATKSLISSLNEANQSLASVIPDHISIENSKIDQTE